MIIAIQGKIGMGKTLFASRLALNYIFIHGWNSVIYSNYHLDFPFFLGIKIIPHVVTDKKAFLDLMLTAKNGLFIVDEASSIFNSRKWASMPDGVIKAFQQSRKRQLDLIYTTQNIKNVDLILRQNTSYLYEAKMVYLSKQNEDDLLNPKKIKLPLKENPPAKPIILRIAKYYAIVSETDSDKIWHKNKIYIRFYFPFQFKHWYPLYNTFEDINYSVHN